MTLPDLEALALDVLNHYLPGRAQYLVSPPAEWHETMPFIWLVRVGGASVNARVDHGVLSVATVDSTRKGASDLARDAQAAFYQAARDGFFSDEGVFSYFETIKGPSPDRDGLTGKHPDSFNFDATYDVWGRSRD